MLRIANKHKLAEKYFKKLLLANNSYLEPKYKY